MLPSIPPRRAFGDTLEGLIIRQSGHALLASTMPEETELLFAGELTIRYGIGFLGKPHYSIVPELVVLDYGEGLAGEDAWNFLLRKSNLYPRADVLGYRNDGVDEMIVVKKLDLMQPVHVLAFTSSISQIPVARLSALITGNQALELPTRLLQYLPQFESIHAWQATQHE